MSFVWHKILKALATLLLALLVASPALAEAGCIADAIEHVHSDSAPVAVDGSDELDISVLDQLGDCAFSHGHCAAVPPAAPDTLPTFEPAGMFTGTSRGRLAAAALGGPERPPRS